MTHTCVGKLTIIGSDNGLAPGRRQTIIWTNDEILLIGPLGTNFSEILIGIQTFLFKKMHMKMSSAKWRPFCLGLNVLTYLNHLCKDQYQWHRNLSVAMDTLRLHWNGWHLQQVTFWYTFSWKKLIVFRLKFHSYLSLRGHSTIILHWFR